MLTDNSRMQGALHLNFEPVHFNSSRTDYRSKQYEMDCNCNVRCTVFAVDFVQITICEVKLSMLCTVRHNTLQVFHLEADWPWISIRYCRLCSFRQLETSHTTPMTCFAHPISTWINAILCIRDMCLRALLLRFPFLRFLSSTWGHTVPENILTA